MRKRVILLAGLLVLVIIGGGLYTAVAKLDVKEATLRGCMIQDPYDFDMPVLIIDAPGYTPF